MPEPADSLTEVLGAMADRVGRYTDIWQNAARANANQSYTTDNALADIQATFTLMVRDLAEAGEAMLKALSAYSSQVNETRSQAPDYGDGLVLSDAVKKSRPVTAKKAAAKKTAAKKASARKSK